MTRLVSAVLAVLCTALALPGQNSGWIDVQEVIFKFKKTKDITDQLEKKMAEHAALVRQQQEKIKGMMESLELAGADGDPLERLRSEKNIKLAQVDLEIQEKNVRYQLEQDLVTHMKKVYRQVVHEAEVIARERRLSYVFMINKGDVEGRTRDELTGNILVKPILYADPALDLTSEVIQRLNK